MYLTRFKNEHCLFLIKNGAGWGVILGNAE
jgi:hypothetical protein